MHGNQDKGTIDRTKEFWSTSCADLWVRTFSCELMHPLYNIAESIRTFAVNKTKQNASLRCQYTVLFFLSTVFSGTRQNKRELHYHQSRNKINKHLNVTCARWRSKRARLFSVNINYPVLYDDGYKKQYCVICFLFSDANNSFSVKLSIVCQQLVITFCY